VGVYREKGARFHLEVHSIQCLGQRGTNCRQLKFQLSSKTKSVVIMRVMKYWNALPKDAVESPSLKRQRI